LVLEESRTDPGELTGKTGTTPRTLGKGQEDCGWREMGEGAGDRRLWKVRSE